MVKVLFRGGKRTSHLDHVEPASGVLVAAVNGLQNAGIGSRGGLGGEAAHLQQHMQDVGEAIALVGVIRRTLIQGPLQSALVHESV